MMRSSLDHLPASGQRELARPPRRGRWKPTAEQLLSHARDTVERGWSNTAAFEPHQATERLHTCFLPVRTTCSPATHNINSQRALAESHEPRLIDVWSDETKFERRCSELLRV